MTLKATELRIGNYVMFNDNYELSLDDPAYYEDMKMFPIDVIASDETIRLMDGDKSIGCFGTNQIKPISITEEWLIKFGFEKFNKAMHKPLNKTTHIYREILDHNNFYITGMDNYLQLTNIPKYVHQLQNLYFALTGKELTI